MLKLRQAHLVVFGTTEQSILSTKAINIYLNKKNLRECFLQPVETLLCIKRPRVKYFLISQLSNCPVFYNTYSHNNTTTLGMYNLRGIWH